MILLGVPVLAGALLLIVAGLEHLRDPAALARAASTGIGTAWVIALAELAIGAPSVAAVLLGIPPLRWALVAQALTYLVFAIHLLRRRRRGDESDCGCHRMGTRVGPGGIARAWALAILTFAAAALSPPAISPGGTGGLTLVIVAAAVLATLLYALPAAVDGPPAPGRPAHGGSS
ncbi:MAG TPA: MauE/DoxX family redox-associated membrane protein [Pseudonocardiaceae bacterium]|nr:MauE/DoxX family redox-associated membrane protein [Pseudonocardiaceae bacterium]